MCGPREGERGEGSDTRKKRKGADRQIEGEEGVNNCEWHSRTREAAVTTAGLIGANCSSPFQSGSA